MLHGMCISAWSIMCQRNLLNMGHFPYVAGKTTLLWWGHISYKCSKSSSHATVVLPFIYLHLSSCVGCCGSLVHNLTLPYPYCMNVRLIVAVSLGVSSQFRPIVFFCAENKLIYKVVSYTFYFASNRCRVTGSLYGVWVCWLVQYPALLPCDPYAWKSQHILSACKTNNLYWYRF